VGGRVRLFVAQQVESIGAVMRGAVPDPAPRIELAGGGWYEPEARPFLAHVTVARWGRGSRGRTPALTQTPPAHATSRSPPSRCRDVIAPILQHFCDVCVLFCDRTRP
jgi:hypothetical protein